ncbi:MAG: hypothetical protein ACK57R_20640 [Dolichospermum sp.]|jgi:ABC-type protease/lipase transport system fused ATPase/permease subunit|nr:hypothetical protein [Anabaena sp. 49628_E55]
MAQNVNVQPLHFAISNIEVPDHLKITVEVKLGFMNQVPSKKYFKATEIANHLQKMTGENWTYQRVIETLAQMGYITKLKPNWPWQPTEKAKHYADFSSRVLKWSPEVINLILQQQPQQLRLAV